MAVATATALIAAASAVSAVGAIQQGQAASKQAKYQSQIYRQQADRERQIADAKEADFRRAQSRLLASRRAAMGASGIDSSSGSPLLVSQDFAGETELQALRIRNGGEVNATRLEQNAQLQQMAGSNARTGGYFRAGSSLLSGFGTAAYYGK